MVLSKVRVLYIELHSKTSSPIDHPQKGKVTHGYSKPEDSNKVGEICAYLSGMMWLCQALRDQIEWIEWISRISR